MATSLAPPLSRIRTLLFGAMAVVWFGEMMMWGFESFAESWTNVWKMLPPDNPQLAAALSITHAAEAPLKGALGVLALFGLRSRDAAARNALYLSMALVPPLNIAFQFRAQGFPPSSVTVAAVLGLILWGSFVLFRDRAPRPGHEAVRSPPTRWEVLQYAWFGANAAALTLLAFLFLFGPRSALDLLFPCWSGLLEAHEQALGSLVISNLGVGAHLLAVGTAGWIATALSRTNPTLRRAVTAASVLTAGLLCLLPLRRLVTEVGGDCATTSILVLAVPALVGWALFAAYSHHVNSTR